MTVIHHQNSRYLKTSHKGHMVIFISINGHFGIFKITVAQNLRNNGILISNNGHFGITVILNNGHFGFQQRSLQSPLDQIIGLTFFDCSFIDNFPFLICIF